VNNRKPLHARECDGCSVAYLRYNWFMNPARTPYLAIGSMRLNAMDPVLTACPPRWGSRAFLSLGGKNKKCFENHRLDGKRENSYVLWMSWVGHPPVAGDIDTPPPVVVAGPAHTSPQFVGRGSVTNYHHGRTPVHPH